MDSSYEKKLKETLAAPERLKALERTELLNSPPEIAFDRITELTHRILGTPIALVSLIAEDYQFFKSALGLPEPIANVQVTPLSHSFCKHVISTGAPIVANDTRVHELVHSVASVQDFGIHTYLGVPLYTPDHQALGTLCTLGFEPRTWSSQDVQTIQDLASMAMSEVALRLELHIQKQLQQQLQISELRYRSMVDEIHDVVIKLDGSGVITFVNPAWQELLGYSVTSTIGHSINEFLPRDEIHGDPFDALLAHAAMDKVYSTHLSSKNGDMKWLELRMTLKGTHGVDNVVGLITDVTDSYRIEAEREARKQAEHHLKLKDALLNNMTHEIRTPISAILSCSEILSDEVEEEQLLYLDMIQSDGERLLTTLDTVLLYAQVISGNISVYSETFDLIRTISSIIERTVPPGTPIEVLAPDTLSLTSDPNFVKHILRCLIDNAVKFTKQGHIHVVVTSLGDRIMVEIDDTGIGIPASKLSRIFIPFEQASSGLSRSHEGTGLGIPLAKLLVDKLQGSFMIESMEGEGTTVRVIIPSTSSP